MITFIIGYIVGAGLAILFIRATTTKNLYPLPTWVIQETHNPANLSSWTVGYFSPIDSAWIPYRDLVTKTQAEGLCSSLNGQ